MTVKEAIKNRRTIRKFLQTPIEREKLVSYIDSARLAASGANLQPLKYAIIDEKETVDKVFDMVKWAAYLKDGAPKENERPTVFIAVVADLNIKKVGYEFDMGAAVTNLILSAYEDGVGTCWMGAINYAGITELLKLPENLKLLAVVALGIIGEKSYEVDIKDNDVKYFKDSEGNLCVPKRSLEEIIL